MEKPPAGVVSLETARRPRRYIEEFLYPHTAYVYSTVMARGTDDDEVRWVAGYILTRDLQTITAREIGRAYQSLRGTQRRAKLRSVMAALAMQDWVKITNETRGEWKINPGVYDGRFAAIKRGNGAAGSGEGRNRHNGFANPFSQGGFSMSTVTGVTYARKEYVFFLLLYPLLWLFLSFQIALSDSGDVWRPVSLNSFLECRFYSISNGSIAHG